MRWPNRDDRIRAFAEAARWVGLGMIVAQVFAVVILDRDVAPSLVLLAGGLIGTPYAIGKAA